MSDKIANLNGKNGRPKGTSALTPMAKKFIDAIYINGTDYSNAYKQAGYKSAYCKKRADEILDLQAAKDYIERLNNDDGLKKKASKSFLIDTLLSRLEKAKDADLVNIIKVINQMMGYTGSETDIKVDNKIQIVWQPLLEIKQD